MRRKMAIGKHGTGGYTLIEMSTVIVVLFLAAALIVPNVVAIWRSRGTADLKADLQRLAAKARNEARSSGDAVSIRVTDGALVMEREPKGESATEVARVAFSSRFQLDSVRSGDTAVELDDWKWTVYPDGPAGAGAVLFRQDGVLESLVFTARGKSAWVKGQPGQLSQDEWSAGEIETRG